MKNHLKRTSPSPELWIRIHNAVIRPTKTLYCNTDLLVQFNIFQNLYGLIVVTKKGMKSQKSHQTKVTKHLVQRMSPKISRNRIRITATSIYLKQNDIHMYNATNEPLSTSKKVKSISNDVKVTSVHTIKIKKEHGGYLPVTISPWIHKVMSTCT